MSTATVTQEQVKEALRLKYKSLDFDRAATEQFLIARNQRSLIPLLDEIERESKTNGHSTEVAEAIAAQADEQPDNLILKAALRCVEKGWYVFALNERAKEPDKEFSPHGFNSSTNDPEVVRAIWTRKPSANYGIDLGRSNLTVLDFDNGKPPAELGLPETLQVSTSRGTHVYLSGVSKQGDMHLNGVHVGEIKSAGGYVLGTTPQCLRR